MVINPVIFSHRTPSDMKSDMKRKIAAFIYRNLDIGIVVPVPLVALTLTLIFALIAPANAAPVIQHWQTANGARVYFVPAPELPMVDVSVIFDAGGVRDEKAKGGLSQLTSGLLDDGAGNLNADQIAEHFEGLGAQFSTHADSEMATVSLRSLSKPDILKSALDVMALVLRQPTFPTADIIHATRERYSCAGKYG